MVVRGEDEEEEEEEGEKNETVKMFGDLLIERRE